MAWDLTRNKIIKGALRKIGVIAQGDEPYPEQLSEGSDALNAFLKSFNIGRKLWKQDWYTVKLTATTQNILGSDGVIYDCLRGHVSASENEPPTGAKEQGFWKDTSVSFDLWVTGTAYVVGDQIYVDNSGYKVYTCNTGHTASAAFITDVANWTVSTTYAAWATATTYYNAGDVLLGTEVMDVLRVWYKDVGNSNRTDTDIDMISSGQFLDIWDKEDTDTYPDYAYVDKKDGGNRLFLRKIPNDLTAFELFVRVEEVIDDLVTPGANPDYNIEFYDMLIYGLAVRLCPDYGIRTGEKNDLKAEFVEAVNIYKQNNKEDVEEETIEPGF